MIIHRGILIAIGMDCLAQRHTYGAPSEELTVFVKLSAIDEYNVRSFVLFFLLLVNYLM